MGRSTNAPDDTEITITVAALFALVVEEVMGFSSDPRARGMVLSEGEARHIAGGVVRRAVPGATGSASEIEAAAARHDANPEAVALLFRYLYALNYDDVLDDPEFARMSWSLTEISAFLVGKLAGLELRRRPQDGTCPSSAR